MGPPRGDQTTSSSVWQLVWTTQEVQMLSVEHYPCLFAKMALSDALGDVVDSLLWVFAQANEESTATDGEQKI